MASDQDDYSDDYNDDDEDDDDIIDFIAILLHCNSHSTVSNDSIVLWGY